MKTVPFTGSGVAIVTPFDENGVNYSELDRLIEFQIQNGTDAIISCGTTGESSTMSDEEHVGVIAHTVKTVAGRVPVIAGTGSNHTDYSIWLSIEAEKAGADGLLLVTPYYNKATQRGVVAHFTAVANAVSLPVIVYDVPARTGMSLTVNTCIELAKVPNIVAVKEASGNVAHAAQIVAACGDELHVYSGNDDVTVPILSIGGKGTISVLANVMPKQTHDMCAQYLCGNTSEATKLQLQMMDLIGALFIEVNPIPVKAAMQLMGYDTGRIRLPLTEIEPQNKEILADCMKKMGVI